MTNMEDKNKNMNMDDLSLERLNKCTVAELKVLCSHHLHNVSGRKSELIKRLLNGSPSIEDMINKMNSKCKCKEA